MTPTYAVRGEFFWAEWNDSNEVVLYFSGTGTTYLLSTLGYLILDQLIASPKTMNELSRSLNNLDELPDDLLPIPEEMIESHLFYLKKWGLVVS